MSAIYRVTFKFRNGTKDVVEGDDLREIMDAAKALMDAKGTSLLDLKVQVIPRGQRIGDA